MVAPPPIILIQPVEKLVSVEVEGSVEEPLMEPLPLITNPIHRSMEMEKTAADTSEFVNSR